MIVPGSAHALLLSQSGYSVPYSLRFRASNTAYIRRIIGASSTSTTIATWSFWIKRGAFGAGRQLIVYNGNAAGTGNTIQLEFTSGSAILAYFNGAGTTGFTTNAVFRDPSAWYHFVLAYDSTQATDSNRFKLYVNGTQITSFASVTYPTLNQAFNAGSGDYQQMMGLGATLNTDGYMAEVNFIDGQALTPSSFGQTDSATGVWVPKKYSGTYGTNGFYLKFADASAATAAAIGKDSSGNGNNWTPNGISVTAGGTFDQITDTPTLNYPVISSLNSQSVVSITEAGMASSYAGVANTGTCLVSVPFPTTGKWYYEHTCLATGASDYWLGVMKNKSIAGNSGNIIAVGTDAGEYSYRFNGQKMIAGVASAYGASYTANDIIGVAFDATNLTIEFFKNGVSQGQLIGMPSGEYIAFTEQYNGGSCRINFGQRAFAYTPPTGFSALNTSNLQAPSIKRGDAYVDAKLYTGNGTSQSVTGYGFQPDLVWIKGRDYVSNHRISDSVRGVNKSFMTNTTGAEDTSSTNYVTAFNANGFLLSSGAGDVNQNTQSYLALAWKKGATPGFDVVTYAGNATNRTIAHSLGAVPAMMIIKNRDLSTSVPVVYHSKLNGGTNPANNYLYTSSTAAEAANSAFFNNTSPTSSVFTVGTDTFVNANAQNLVAYLWTEIAGFSKIGSYAGNGLADGPFVWCGFRPRFLLLKNASAITNWEMMDSSRDTSNPSLNELYPNSGSAENASTADEIDFVSSGFKLRSANSIHNASGNTIIFAAFAENPFKYARAR